MKVSVTLATLAAVVSTVVAAPTAILEARQYGGDTYNQLTDGTPCRDITVIYARGTTQDGNVNPLAFFFFSRRYFLPRLPLTTNFTFPQVGDPAAVGPLIFNALAGIVGTDRLAVQGVTYAANILGFLLGGDPNGGKVMAANAATVCFHYRCDGVKEETGGYPRKKKGEKKS